MRPTEHGDEGWYQGSAQGRAQIDEACRGRTCDACDTLCAPLGGLSAAGTAGGWLGRFCHGSGAVLDRQLQAWAVPTTRPDCTQNAHTHMETHTAPFCVAVKSGTRSASSATPLG